MSCWFHNWDTYCLPTKTIIWVTGKGDVTKTYQTRRCFRCGKIQENVISIDVLSTFEQIEQIDKETSVAKPETPEPLKKGPEGPLNN